MWIRSVKLPAKLPVKLKRDGGFWGISHDVQENSDARKALMELTEFKEKRCSVKLRKVKQYWLYDLEHATNFNHERQLNSFKWAISQIEVLEVLAIWNIIFLWILRFTGKEKEINLIVLLISTIKCLPFPLQCSLYHFLQNSNFNRYINHEGTFCLALKKLQLYLQMITVLQHFLSMYQTAQGNVVSLVTLFNSFFFCSVYIALELILARNNLIT